MLDKLVFNCHTTDTGNAEALALIYGDRLRYVHGLGWHVWTGNYWKPDANGMATKIVTELSEIRQKAVERYANAGKHKKDMMSAVVNLENSGKIDSCLKVSESMYPFSTSTELVDNYPMLLTCPNGTVDLENGKLYSSLPSNMITNCTGVNFNPNAVSEVWIQFLKDIFLTKVGTPDYQLIGWLQKVLGYSLTDSISERAIYICFGEGANGKSTLLNIVNYVMGSYAVSAAFSHFLESRSENSNDLATLRGKRFVAASEAGPGKFLDEVKIKQMTGGDQITCRFLYKEFFSYRPTYKIFLACNDRPRIKGTDNAIWDRLKIIPFNVRFKDEDRDVRLYDKLVKEAEGILAWMVKGCIRWQIEGLADCNTVANFTKIYKTEEDAFARFFRDKVNKVMGGFITVEELWKAYNGWAKANGETEITNTIAIGHKMRKLGYQSSVSGKYNSRGFKGLEL